MIVMIQLLAKEKNLLKQTSEIAEVFFGVSEQSHS